MLTDRYEVIESEDPQDKNASVNFYGYVRGGVFMNTAQQFHINGIGDYSISYVSKLDDPCPIEFKVVDGKKKKRSLKQKEKTIYAPLSSLGSVNIDKHQGGYISIPDKYVMFTKITDEDGQVINEAKGEGQQMVREMQEGEKEKEEEEEDIDLIEGVEIQTKEEKKKEKESKGGKIKTLKIDTEKETVSDVKDLKFIK